MVSTSWQIDAHTFELPLVAAPSDAIVSPATAFEVERLGGLAVLDPRLRTKGYGRRFIDSLPPAPVVHTLADIERFFRA